MLIVLRRLRNFPMLMLLGLLFALMSLKANWVLGAPYLFWHDDFIRVGIIALFSVALLLEEWAFVAVLLDTDENNPINLSTPGQHHSRISLLAAVKDYLDIERFAESNYSPMNRDADQLPGNVITTAAGGMNRLSKSERNQIYATVREIHSVGTYTLAFLFGFSAAFFYQWQNENLIAFHSMGLSGYDLNGVDFLGPLLIGGCLVAMVYSLFYLRRIIQHFEKPLTSICDRAYRDLSKVPFIGRIIANWVFAEIIREDNLFKCFHLIAFVKNLIFVVLMMVLSLIFWSGYRSSADPSVALIVCVVLSGFLGIYGWIVFQRRRLRYEFVIAVALGLILASVLFIDQIPRPVRLANQSNAEPEVPSSPDAALATVASESILQEVEREIWIRQIRETPAATVADKSGRTEQRILENWKTSAGQSLLDNSGSPLSYNEKPIMVLISNTGGGIKAQVWSSLVLHAVESLISQPDQEGNFIHFPKHVRLVAGASGGMVGAGYWVATLDDSFNWHQDPESKNQSILFHRDKDRHGSPIWLTAEDTVSRMSRDCLSQVARQGFFNDLLGMPLRAVGFPLPTRGEALEDALVQSGPAFQTPFSDLAIREFRGELPTLIYTPTSANDGRRFLICNQPLEYLFHSQFAQGGMHKRSASSNSADDTESVAAYSWRLNYPDSQMSLATAARLSANFPVFVDSPYLPFQDKDSRLRIMDAGYGDNHGVYPLAAWLDANREWLKNNTGGVVLIQIAASSLPRNNNDNFKGPSIPEGLGFVTTSFNKTLFHADRKLHNVASYLNRNDEDFFKVVTFAYDGEASLSWYLSRVERLSLAYPFFSDRQAKALIPENIDLKVKSAIPFEVITTSSKTFDASTLGSGINHFRMHDFRKAERLRGVIGAKLETLKSWWLKRLFDNRNRRDED